MGMAMKHITVFETAEEVVRAFRTGRHFIKDEDTEERRRNDPYIPSDVILVLRPGASPYFTGDGSDVFDLADNITYSDIIRVALSKAEVRFDMSLEQG